jgi:hypothetical protein
MKRVLVISLLLGVLAVGNGCCLLDAIFCGPCGPACGPACGPVCGPACGPCGPECCDPCGPGCCDPCGPGCCDPCGPGCCDSCGPGCCDPCGPGCCDPCGPGCCDPCCDPCGVPCGDPCCGSCAGPCAPCAPCGPLGCVIGVLDCVKYGACGCGYGCEAGCGDVYCGDWISSPPDYCDPCDCHGNWIGPGCSSCGSYGPAPEHVMANRAHASNPGPRIIAQSDKAVGQAKAKPIASSRSVQRRQAPVARQCSRGQCRRPM